LSRLDLLLTVLTPELLRGLLRGVEKEGLRVQADGTLSCAPHPVELGSALTHPYIITDFSEAQLELITGVHASADACVDQLREIHQVVYRNIGDEMLWCSSMPCKLPPDDEIPIGQYGRSNVGMAKTIYRRGLSHRYGRRMQTISGIHYNFSLPEAAWPELQRSEGKTGPVQDYQNDAYFSLIRNFRRYSWLLLFLFGASPAVCGSFVSGRMHDLQELKPGTMYLPGSTSLRMGRLGYQSDAQASLTVSYNSLESYANSLYHALTEPYPPYTAIGIRDGEDYLQLNTTLLQIENEFYGTIRPKRPIRPGERPLHALGERGVEYVEVRCMDIDPFSPIGITAATMRFLDMFLLYCLLKESAPDTPEELAVNAHNQRCVAERGRDPDIRLDCFGKRRTPSEWGGDLLKQCEPIAAALDHAHRGSAYREILALAHAALENPEMTPSARILKEIEQIFEGSYLEFARAKSIEHRDYLRDLTLRAEAQADYARMAQESLAIQRKLEAADHMPFESYRRQYLSQDLLSGIRLRSHA